jgi:hypothetical protein
LMYSSRYVKPYGITVSVFVQSTRHDRDQLDHATDPNPGLPLDTHRPDG